MMGYYYISEKNKGIITHPNSLFPARVYKEYYLPCSRKMYINANPSKGPQNGNSEFVTGKDIKEQLTDFSAIFCTIELLQAA